MPKTKWHLRLQKPAAISTVGYKRDQEIQELTSEGRRCAMAQMQVELHPDAKGFGPEVQAILQQLSPSQIAYFNALYEKRRKEPFATFYLSLLGFDRFYLQQHALGFLKLLTGGGFGLWWLADIGTFQERTRAVNEQIALEVARQVKDLVDPNAPPPVMTGRKDNLLLAVLAAVAFFLLAFAVALMVR